MSAPQARRRWPAATRTVSWAGLVVLATLAGCACDPGVVEGVDAEGRRRRDASIDAPPLDAPPLDAPPLDAPGDDAPGDDAAQDAYVAPFDGCVSGVSLARAGAPCLDESDCPADLSCIEGGSLSPGSSCALIAPSDCACPVGSSAVSSVSASGVVTICAPSTCPARNTDPGGLGSACATLRDCPDWMVCERGACAMPCGTDCPCPSETACESVVTASGVGWRCVLP